MGLFGRKKRSLEAGLYGKHPDAGDFIRVNAGGAELRALDEWLSGAMVAAGRLVPDWERSYLAADPVSMIFNPGSKSGICVIATLAPSTDRSGRRFPLVLFAEVGFDALTETFPGAPLLAFFEMAQSLHARRQSIGQAELLERARGLVPPDAAAFDRAARRQEAYLDSTTVGQAFRDGGGWIDQALHELQGVCRDVTPNRPLPRFGVRLPLGPPPAEQASLWLRLLRDMCSVRLVPNVLWTDHRLALYLDRPSSKALVSLWRGEWQDETVFDLGQSPSTSSRFSPEHPLRALVTAVS